MSQNTRYFILITAQIEKEYCVDGVGSISCRCKIHTYIHMQMYSVSKCCTNICYYCISDYSVLLLLDVFVSIKKRDGRVIVLPL